MRGNLPPWMWKKGVAVKEEEEKGERDKEKDNERDDHESIPSSLHHTP